MELADDPNGGNFGDWLIKRDSSNVTCRLCHSNVCLKEGEKALSKHNATTKHREAQAAQAATGNIVGILLGKKSRIFVTTLLRTLYY